MRESVIWMIVTSRIQYRPSPNGSGQYMVRLGQLWELSPAIPTAASGQGALATRTEHAGALLAQPPGSP